MGLLDRAIKQGVNRAVNKAVSNTVERKVDEAATAAVNKAADAIVPTKPAPQQAQYQAQPTASQQEAYAAGAQLGGFFGGFAGAAQTMANTAAANMKICPACNAPAGADVKFCPECGAGLPEQTVAQGSVCTNCGKQNNIGIKFCADCGTKLPAAIAEERAAQQRDAATLAKWEELLSQYPKWNQGGRNINLETQGMGDNGYPYYSLYVDGVGVPQITGYSQLLKQHGFRPAGEYPSEQQLFKRIDGVVYSFDAEHAFEGGSDTVCLYFTAREPHGGFDYVKPEPKKPTTLRGLFKI